MTFDGVKAVMIEDKALAIPIEDYSDAYSPGNRPQATPKAARGPQ